ncbi:MAG: SMI1/KNR4 family protein [Planctomycetota bacterium]
MPIRFSERDSAASLISGSTKRSYSSQVDDSKRQQIGDAFAALTEACEYSVATASDLFAFESAFVPIPDDLRWFPAVRRGTIGSEWVDGIDELVDTHRNFRSEFHIRNGWTMHGVFVIGWDGAGNPFAIETVTGEILVEDRNFGGIYEMSPSFAESLERGRLSKK